MAVSTGFGAVAPNPHSEAAFTVPARRSRSFRSSPVPCPSQIRVRMRSICLVPSRQGAHLPHDSSAVKVRKNRARSTMQVRVSSTIIPPEPIIEPASLSFS